MFCISPLSVHQDFSPTKRQSNTYQKQFDETCQSLSVPMTTLCRSACCCVLSLTVFSCTTQFVILNKKHSYFLWFIFAERKHFQRRACAASVKVRVFIRVRQAQRFHLYGPLINWSRGSDVSFSEIEVHVSEKVNWNERVENSLRRSLQKSLCTPKSPVLSLNS